MKAIGASTAILAILAGAALADHGRGSHATTTTTRIEEQCYQGNGGREVSCNDTNAGSRTEEVVITQDYSGPPGQLRDSDAEGCNNCTAEGPEEVSPGEVIDRPGNADN